MHASRVQSGGDKRARRRTHLRQDNKFLRAVTVKEELQRLVNAVRAKYKLLRQGADEMHASVERSARPFVLPLQKAVVEGIKAWVPTVKVEPTKEEKGEVEESGADELDKTLDTSTQTEKIKSLPEKYLARLADPSYREKMDTVYGIRPSGSGGLLMGNSRVSFTAGMLKVGDEYFDPTRGLLELIFMKVPNRLLFTRTDLSTYKDLLLATNAHRQSYSSEKPINANRGKKYTSVLSELFYPKSSGDDPFKGSGIHAKDQFTSYTENANSLVNRLRLLILSRSAGHSGHNLEISTIIDTLRTNQIIA